jgi:hypothetical protein
MAGYPAGKNGKQYRQTVGMLFWNTTGINCFTNTFTQFLGVALTNAIGHVNYQGSVHPIPR